MANENPTGRRCRRPHDPRRSRPLSAGLFEIARAGIREELAQYPEAAQRAAAPASGRGRLRKAAGDAGRLHRSRPATCATCSATSRRYRRGERVRAGDNRARGASRPARPARGGREQCSLTLPPASGTTWRAAASLQTSPRRSLSLRASVHRTEISQLERGLRIARIDTLVKLRDALEVSSDDLLAGIVWTPVITGRVAS